MGISQYDQLGYAQYKPISLQEMWAPAAAMREQHDKLQEEYAQQEQQGGLSLLGIDPVKDKAAYDIQQGFIAKTKEAADQLATKGFIDSGRRRGLMELKSLYSNQVVPLQNQLKIRQERTEELRKMQLQDPTFRATINPNDISLTEGLKSPTAFNYDGVSGNQLYSTAAKKLEQLSKTINQDVPELKKMPKLSFQYFTAIQSGATPDQAANAMKREGYDPSVVDKMTNMIHGTIDSTMQEFGVYDKFKNDPKTIEELWNTTSQAAYNAIGTKQFGNVTDSWGQSIATKALSDTPPPNGLMDEERYDPDYDKNEISKIDKLIKIATGDRNTLAGIQTGVVAGGELSPESKSIITNEWRNLGESKQKADARHEIFKIGESLGIKPKKSSTGNMSISEFKNYASRVAEAQKELFKTANKMKTISNTSKDVAGGIVSNLMSRDAFKDIDGEDVKYDSKSMANITTDFNFKKGLFLNIPSEDGKIKKVKFDVSDLNTPAITDAYMAVQRIDAGVPTQKDIDLVRNSGVATYGDYKNLVAKDIRTRMSLTPGVTTVKP